MKYRRATNDDINEIKSVVFSALEEHGLKSDPTNTDVDLNDLDKYYFANGGYFEVCERNGKIIGTWGLFPINSTSCELRKMYLISSERGKGIGSEMLKRAIKKARELGLIRIELETASVLKEAMILYQKYGFKAISGRHLASRCDQAFELHL